MFPLNSHGSRFPTSDEIFAVILNIDTILTQTMKASTLNTFDNIDTKLLELLRTFAINNSIIMILESMEEALLRRNKVIIKSCSRIIFYVIMKKKCLINY
jgi:hypothetical protein